MRSRSNLPWRRLPGCSLLAAAVFLLLSPPPALTQRHHLPAEGAEKPSGFTEKFVEKFSKKLENLRRTLADVSPDSALWERLHELERWRSLSASDCQQGDFEQCQARLHNELETLQKQANDEFKTLRKQANEELKRSRKRAGKMEESSPSEVLTPKGPGELVGPGEETELKDAGMDVEPEGGDVEPVEPPGDCEPSFGEVFWKQEMQTRSAQALVSLYCKIVKDGCETSAKELEHAESYILEQRDKPEDRESFEVLEECERAAAELAADEQATAERIAAAEQATAEPAAATDDLSAAPGSSLSRPAMEIRTEMESYPRVPETVTGTVDGRAPEALAFDVWQSAWGDFSDFEVFADYADRNHITEVNLNIGMPVNADWEDRVKERLSDLTEQLRSRSVQRINLMYAERAYPIGEFAAFLARHSDLGINTIIDDSEFVDAARHRFTDNLEAVRQKKIRYGAFVTLEGKGNSGVGDETRKWVLRNVDEPILMSYFACSVDGQRESAGRFLDYADEKVPDRSRFVKVALLLGGKSVGRERSCEKELGEREFQDFLRDLHNTFLRHRSYGGIVLETNRRRPRYDVAQEELSFSEPGTGALAASARQAADRLQSEAHR